MQLLRRKDCPGVKVACFSTPGAATEYHLTLLPQSEGTTHQQAKQLYQMYEKVLSSLGLSQETTVFQRFFFSDLINQRECLLKSFSPLLTDISAISLVEQPPLPPAKIALWAYHLSDSQLKKNGTADFLSLSRGKITHHWLTGITATQGKTSYQQTYKIFQKCARLLQKKNMNLADNLLRTWIFVRDIDYHYQGMVKARKEFFATCGLTPQTHFVASSGIGGGTIPEALVTLDAYAVSGLTRQQVRYLSAPDHLSPTYIYGVTFERGTSIIYADRKHHIISGTASIDKSGQILYPGDLDSQLDRTLENISALLTAASATLKDVACFICYVRDPADQKKIQLALENKFPQTPFLVLFAPVCRTGWLVEVECVAITRNSAPNLPRF